MSEIDRWWVVDRDRDYAKLRGPYADASTAGAVRTEMERSHDEKRNLWIVSDDTLREEAT